MLFANKRVVCFMTARSKEIIEKRLLKMSQAGGGIFQPELPAIQRELRGLLHDDGSCTHNGLATCMDFLACILDDIDETPELSFADVKPACEFLFNKIVEQGIWGDDELDDASDMIAITAF